MRLGVIKRPDDERWRAAAFMADDRAVDLAAAAAALGRAHAAFESGVANGAWLSEAGRAAAQHIVSAAPAAATVSMSEVVLGPPVPQPRTFIAAGRNYVDHLREGQRLWASRGKTVEKASFPTGFVKLSSAIVSHGEPIRIPRGVDNVDYEIELAVVIGRRAKNVAVADALDHVAGYTICNDVGARRIQMAEMEHQIGLALSKNFPSFAPLGPWLVTADEIRDPQALALELKVNGEVRQHAGTADMIFPVAELVSYWSRLGLEPGDVISTGTPSGVALARPDPAPFYLKAGDMVEATISGIGTLRNPVAGEI
jgi:2-keto-4-pentenoate hydratase/2-oxohepta-3-ene-1,7-dioic acid hydratase in catechol pathway